jgi:hypothetical protein
MPKLYLFITSIFLLLLICSCSKKHHPGKTLENNSSNVKSSDSLTTKKIVTPKRKVATPKVIVVNDNAASKSVDGRLYYDLLGHRYWKNYKDGKYYLFSQSMYNNDDFKPK